MKYALLLTCEHGGRRVPSAFAHLFQSKAAAAALTSHRGQDIGAQALAKALAIRLDAPLYAYTFTRLLIDLNRSIGHPKLFSEFSRRLDGPARRQLIARYYEPHRSSVIEAIGRLIGRRMTVLHIAVHSFTPTFGGQTRAADIGLLYDPRRHAERALCDYWRSALRMLVPELRVRRNYPYRGTADGFTTHLRRQFGGGSYLGIELEASQRLLAQQPRDTADFLAESLNDTTRGGRALAPRRPRR